jgi:ABC-type transporter Mla subunit MlaD
MNGSGKSLLLLLCSAVAVAVVAAGCGGGGGSSSGSTVSVASFCSDITSFAAKYRSVETSLAPPSKTTLANAASDLQKLASSAPSAVDADMQTEADALSQWAKNGDDTPMHSNAFSTADQKLGDWRRANCSA